MRKTEQVYLKQVKPLDGLLRDRPSPTTLNKRRNRWLIAVAVAVIAIVGLVYALPYLAQSQAGVCAIKGNISSNGERIYHVPGQLYYYATKISVGKGERWFCTEQEAVRSGWRKAKI